MTLKTPIIKTKTLYLAICNHNFFLILYVYQMFFGGRGQRGHCCYENYCYIILQIVC